MTSASGRSHNQDTTDLYAAIQNGTLPAVSFVKPDGWLDGHPASSKLNLFEGFVKKIVDGVKANPRAVGTAPPSSSPSTKAAATTTRATSSRSISSATAPVFRRIVVSPWARPGHISHAYTDHVSILKFIEANWRLSPLTARSRDNFPNPQASQQQSLRPAEQPSHRRHDGPVQFQRPQVGVS